MGSAWGLCGYAFPFGGCNARGRKDYKKKGFLVCGLCRAVVLSLSSEETRQWGKCIECGDLFIYLYVVQKREKVLAMYNQSINHPPLGSDRLDSYRGNFSACLAYIGLGLCSVFSFQCLS